MLDDEKRVAILTRFYDKINDLTNETTEQCRIAGMSLNEGMAVITAGLVGVAISNNVVSSRAQKKEFDVEDFVRRIRNNIEKVSAALDEKLANRTIEIPNVIH